MGKTAEHMTQQHARNMRNFIDGLFKQNETQTYFVAIKKTYYVIDTDDWSVFLYAEHKESSFLIELASLGHALESICNNLRSRISTYDAGTTEYDARTAVEIY